MNSLPVLLLLLIAVPLGLVMAECRRKNMHIWLSTYLRRRPPRVSSGPVHIMFAFVDHFEPQWGRPTYEVEVARVARWREGYKALASRHSVLPPRPWTTPK